MVVVEVVVVVGGRLRREWSRPMEPVIISGAGVRR